MSHTPSPLRYPGGKTAIWPLVSKLILDNGFSKGVYVEPYAGGCGLALTLLLKNYVHELHLNDLDRSIYCFWQAILNEEERFIARILETEVTINEWHKQREIQLDKDSADDFELGFSSFFLNRTNRSGIILKAGVIGGLGQAGDYKLDCRFNKAGLIDRIRRINKYKSRIHLYNMDAVDFVKHNESRLPLERTIYCIDPPYFSKGSTLYTNFYEEDDHVEIANTLLNSKSSWILTYDNALEIQRLYSNKRQFHFNINYSAQDKKIGTELLVVSDNLYVPSELGLKVA